MRSRRSWLALAAAGGGIYALRQVKHSIPPRDTAAEERFRRLQDDLLAKSGVRADSRYVTLSAPAVRTHVITAGAGEPVVLFHGGSSVAASWIPLLANLAGRFRVYAPDRPGCGLTDKFNYLGVAMREHAVAFVGGVMDGLGLERAALAGNSMGGYFALVFALAQPERVTRLALLGEPAGSAPKIRWTHRLIGTRGVNGLLYSTVMKPGPEATRRTFERLLVADIRRVNQPYLDCMSAAAEIPGAVESWITMVENSSSWTGASKLTYTLRPELGRLHQPALVLWGDKDSFGPPSLGAEMARLMPSARLEVLPGAGHLPWVDQPERTAELLAAFLG